MTSTRRFLTGGCCALAIAAGSEIAAQSAAESPATPAAAEEAKVPWWGGRFALYLETSVGGASTDTVDASLETTLRQVAFSTFDPGDRTYGRIGIGWQLPLNRGLFLLRVSGYTEDGGWELKGVGAAATVSGTSATPDDPLPWWSIRMTEGQLVATRNPPLWSIAQDTDGDSEFDVEEVVYGTIDQTSVVGAPTTLQQRSRSFDLLYQREFADKGPTDRWTGRWSAGMRHFELEGAVPMAGWLADDGGTAGSGIGDPGLFSEGSLLRPLLLNQDTSSNGPAGTLEVQYHFLRRRASAYAQGRAAFLVQTLSADSGLVYTLTRRSINGGPDAFFPTPLHLQHEVDKSAWQIGAEVGLRFRLLPGLVANLEYHREAQQDVLLMPDRLNIPADIDEAPFGSNAIFTTQDLDHDGWSAGLGFQF